MSSAPSSSTFCPGVEFPAEAHKFPASDEKVAFKGFAGFAPKEDVKPWSYNPPQLGDEFVEIAISHCGICGSDIHALDSGWFPTPYPIIPGHEIVGHIVAKGSAVKDLAIGQRVGVGAQSGACYNRNKDCPECQLGHEQHCTVAGLLTYAGKRADGSVSQGGYADRVRVDSHWVFPIPEKIPSEYAAPMLCGGVTVFAPLQRHVTRPGMKVGIIGIGGLGHMGVLFASKLHGGDIDLVAISHNSKKKDAALQMGAKSFLDTSDKDAMKSAARSFDFLLCTANGNRQSYGEWLGLVKLDGIFCPVGVPEEPLQLDLLPLLFGRVHIVGSVTGSLQEIRDMLAFAAKHDVRPIIERLPMKDANKGLQKMRDGSVRFRVVLEN